MHDLAIKIQDISYRITNTIDNHHINEDSATAHVLGALFVDTMYIF